MHVTLKMLDPELRLAGALIRAILPHFSTSSFSSFGRLMPFLKGRSCRGMTLEEAYVPRDDGKELRLCVNRPEKQNESSAGVLWIHGGGYGLGIPEVDVGFIKLFAIEHGCTVVSPDYRLSVEAPYPAALEDCYTALRWMGKNAGALNIKQDQLMVGGDSAGGGLAAALCVLSRERGGPKTAFQMPLYPMIDDTMTTPSSQNNDAPVWNTLSNESAWRLYLGALYGSADLAPTAAPARLTDFHGLPPAFSFVGDVEPFYDETVEYFERLRAAGVPAELEIFKGCFHAFDTTVPRSRAARRARRLLSEAFARAKEKHYA